MSNYYIPRNAEFEPLLGTFPCDFESRETTMQFAMQCWSAARHLYGRENIQYSLGRFLRARKLWEGFTLADQIITLVRGTYTVTCDADRKLAEVIQGCLDHGVSGAAFGSAVTAHLVNHEWEKFAEIALLNRR